MKRNRLFLPIGLIVFFFLSLGLTQAQSCVQNTQGANPAWELGLVCQFSASSAPFGGFRTNGIIYWQISWVVNGTISSASLSLDSSTTGLSGSWTTGGILSAATIGSLATTGHYGLNSSPTTSSNYGQLTPSITGSGIITVTLLGYSESPSLPSGAQGKAVANSNGGAAYSTQGGTFYGDSYFTTDIFAAANSTLQQAYSQSTLAARVDMTGITGSQTATASLFPSSSMPSAARINYGASVITVNQPIVQLNRTEIEGWGMQGTSGQAGTTFVAGTNFPQGCGGNYGTACNGTVSYTATSGSITLTGSGTNFNTLASNGTGYVRPGCRVLTGTVSANGDRSTTTALWGYVTAVASDTSLTLQVEGSVGGTQSAQAWATDCAMFTAGDGRTNPIFSVGLKSAIVSCNNVRGCVPVRNAYAEEYSYLERLTVRDYTNIGIDNEGSTTQNFDHIKEITFAAGSSCTANTIDLVERSLGGSRETLGEMSDTHGPCSTVQNVSFDFESDGESISYAHFEKAGVAVEVGASSNTVGAGFFVQPQITCRACTVRSITAGGSSPFVTTLVDIGGTNRESDVHIGQIQGLSSVSSATNLLVDLANSNTITSACQASGAGGWDLGTYDTDEAGKANTNAKAACITNGTVSNSGNLYFINSGTTEFQITGSTGSATSAGIVHAHNTQLLTADSAGVTATTPGTTIFTWGPLPASTNFALHCSGTYSQATGTAADGIAIQGATNAPTRIDAWGKMYVSNPASTTVTASLGSLANLTTTTATSVVTATPGATATIYQWELDAAVQVGASATTLNVNFFTGSGSDALTVKAGSYCALTP